MLVEGKLWRNPEARRSVIAQALEYASAVFRMTYQDLQNAVRKARSATKMSNPTFFGSVAQSIPMIVCPRHHKKRITALEKTGRYHIGVDHVKAYLSFSVYYE